MNRLTVIGLASLVAYGALVATKYAASSFVAPEPAKPAAQAPAPDMAPRATVAAVAPEPRQSALTSLPAPLPRAERPMRASVLALEFRAARDLKTFAEGLASRRGSLTGEERYFLAKALEECQFATTITEDLAAYSAKQKRQFLAGLPAGDALNPKRIAAYEAVDTTQRCLGFASSKISQKDIDDLFRAAAQQGDPRAQARILTAELNKTLANNNRTADPAQNQRVDNADLGRLISLLESHDPEAMMIVGQFLAQSAMTSQLRVGPRGEVPEPSALLGAFSLVACDLGPDCVSLSREPQFACAHGGFCDAQSFEELYQNFLASPWTYTQAIRYRGIIHTAINTRNWSLIGLVPPTPAPNAVPQ